MSQKHGMIEPFVDSVRAGVVSFAFVIGYDIRVTDEFKVFTNINSTVIDPKNFDPRSFVDYQGRRLHRASNSFALARTIGNSSLATSDDLSRRSTYALRHHPTCAVRANWGLQALGFQHDAAARNLRRRGLAQSCSSKRRTVPSVPTPTKGQILRGQQGVTLPRRSRRPGLQTRRSK